jgi:hypothetical protein
MILRGDDIINAHPPAAGACRLGPVSPGSNCVTAAACEQLSAVYERTGWHDHWYAAVRLLGGPILVYKLQVSITLDGQHAAQCQLAGLWKVPAVATLDYTACCCV